MKKIIAGAVMSAIVALMMAAAVVAPSRADTEVGNAEILAKLDNVIKAQDEVKKSLAEIKDELNIIKIRVTQMQ